MLMSFDQQTVCGMLATKLNIHIQLLLHVHTVFLNNFQLIKGLSQMDVTAHTKRVI